MTRPCPDDLALSEGPRLRGRRELGAQLDALHHWQGGEPTAEFYRGATAALAWLLTGGPGPLTGRGYARPVTTLVLITELARADDLIRTGRPRRRHYLIGLEHALQWAGHETAVPPLPVSSDAQPPPRRRRADQRRDVGPGRSGDRDTGRRPPGRAELSCESARHGPATPRRKRTS